VLGWVIGVVLCGLLLLVGRRLFRMLSVRGKGHVERSGGVLVLRQPKGRFLLLGGLALAPTILVATVVTPLAQIETSQPAGLAAVGAMVLVGLVASSWLFASEWRNRIRADDDALERVGVATRRRVPWADVTRIAYNPNGPWFVLTASDGGRLWLPETLEGVGDLARLALARLPPAVLQANPHAREALEEGIAFYQAAAQRFSSRREAPPAPAKER